MRGRTGKPGRDIWNTIVDYAIFIKNRLLMGRDTAGLETPAAVDTYVYDHAPGSHIADHLVADYHRGTPALRRQRSYGYLTGLDLFGQDTRLDHRGPHPLPDIVLETFQTVYAVIENLYRRPQCKRGPRRKLPDDTRPQYDHFGRRNTGDTPQ